MDAIGIQLSDLMDLSGAPEGLGVEGNNLFLQLLAVLPPPEVRGTLRSVGVEGDRMRLAFGPSDAGGPASEGQPTLDSMPVPDAPNFMYFRFGVLRFGKLYMPDADMEVVDESPDDPFDFFLRVYNRQLVAGYTRNWSDYGLEVHMVDYGKLGPSPDTARSDSAP